MSGRNSRLYLGYKWTNITVGEIIRLFKIILRISIDPHNMGGYPYYFVEDPMIHLGHVYSVQLRVYDAWGKYVMTLTILKHIQSEFHPEAGTSLCGYKCHQLHYFIRMFYDKQEEYLFLGSMVILRREELTQGEGTVLYTGTTNINSKNIECNISSWTMKGII